MIFVQLSPDEKCDEFGGKFYSLYPLGWLKVPSFEFKTNYERGLCFPKSCSKEHVLLLMTKMKPSEFEELSFQTGVAMKFNRPAGAMILWYHLLIITLSVNQGAS